MYDDSEQINPRQRMRYDKLSPSSDRNRKLEAMARILILDRASRGYNPLTPEANLQAAEAFVGILDRGKVPAELYQKLYDRFTDYRTRLISNGQQSPNLIPELLLSLWTGANGLRVELLDKKPERPDNDPYECLICSDTGFEYVKSERLEGVRRCSCREGR